MSPHSVPLDLPTHYVSVGDSTEVAFSCAVLHIKPAKAPAESLHSHATAQVSTDHSISSVLLSRNDREQQLICLLHRCAVPSNPEINARRR